MTYCHCGVETLCVRNHDFSRNDSIPGSPCVLEQDTAPYEQVDALHGFHLPPVCECALRGECNAREVHCNELWIKVKCFINAPLTAGLARYFMFTRLPDTCPSSTDCCVFVL